MKKWKRINKAEETKGQNIRNKYKKRSKIEIKVNKGKRRKGKLRRKCQQ